MIIRYRMAKNRQSKTETTNHRQCATQMCHKSTIETKLSAVLFILDYFSNKAPTVVSNEAIEIQMLGWLKILPVELASRWRFGLGVT